MTAYIAYDDLLSLSDTVHVTTPVVADIDNGFNGQSWNVVVFPVSGTQTYVLESTFAAEYTVNYIAFLHHNLHLASSIKVEVFRAGVWVQGHLSSQYAGPQPGIIILDDTYFLVTKMRLTVVIASPLRFSVLYCGKILELPSGIEPSFTVPSYGRVSKRYPAKSQTGHYLGTRQDFKGWQCTITQRHIAASWMRENYLPMMRQIETWPFFFAWDFEIHREDIVFAWLKDRQRPPRYINPIHQEFTLSCDAIHEV